MSASAADVPHISSLGRSRLHTAGRSGIPNTLQRLSSVNCMQRTPAGLPFGIPGIGDEIDSAIQHAPHPTRQSMLSTFRNTLSVKSQLTSLHHSLQSFVVLFLLR